MTLILHDLTNTEILVNWNSVFYAAPSQFGGSVLGKSDRTEEKVMVTETIAQIAVVVGAVAVP